MNKALLVLLSVFLLAILVFFFFSANKKTNSDRSVGNGSKKVSQTKNQVNQTKQLSTTNQAEPITSLRGPRLWLEPSKGDFKVGSIFDVKILIDSDGKTVAGAGISSLNYDPKKLEIQDADKTMEGIQIRKGDVFDMVMINKVDSAAGKIKFSSLTKLGQENYIASGNLATITFKVLEASPDEQLIFDFKPGLTTDCNIISFSDSKDILQVVGNATIKLLPN
ncbi:MAG: cohesin domain-containing protein [Patescibacteria group bacterium]